MLQCNGILLINTEGLNLSAIWENISIYKKEKVELRRLSCKHNDSLCYKPNENKTRAIWRRECWPLSPQPRSFFPSLYTEYTLPRALALDFTEYTFLTEYTLYCTTILEPGTGYRNEK